jgi:hypothetical protein
MNIQIAFLVISIIALILYCSNLYFRLYQENIYNSRFVILPTWLDIYDEGEEEDDLSDDIKKLIGQDNKEVFKRVKTETIIDLEQILLIEQWTSSKFSDDHVLNDCSKITFKGGDRLVVIENVQSLEYMLCTYQDGKKYKFIKKKP